MKTLYFDCFAGASGNMILGGLIALGIDRDELIRQLKGLSVAEINIEITNVDRAGISSVHVNVITPPETKHRHLHNIEKIISDSDLSDMVKKRSISIFTRLAEAEAAVHGIDVGKVHFHEVGALDAIIDVVGSCIGFEMLGIERFLSSKIHMGSGFVQMEHGTYPVPPPAVERLLHGVPAYATDIIGELITPTGAAIIISLSDSYGPLPEMIVEHSGYGAGTRVYDKFPNVLRLMVGETAAKPAASSNITSSSDSALIRESLVVLETNVDDMPAQAAGFVIEKAMSIGALDCWVTPIQMKKNRPAFLISVLCEESSKGALNEMLFLETTTLGIRTLQVERASLPRENVSVETRFGPIDVKAAFWKGSVVNVMPEFEQVKNAALEHDVPFRTVFAEAAAAFKGVGRSAVSQ